MFRNTVVKQIIYLNVIVFLLWFLTADGTLPFLFMPIDFMPENFLVSWDHLLDGRIWTLLTSVFSHNMLLHLLLNMYVLSSFGPVVEGLLGGKAFLRFYLIAGVVSSLCHALVSAFILGRPDLSALGASGAISGLILLFSLVFPRQTMLLFGFIPVRALFGALIFVGLDLWGLAVQAEGGGLPIGHGAHLGGALCGAIYYFVGLRPRLQRRYY